MGRRGVGWHGVNKINAFLFLRGVMAKRSRDALPVADDEAKRAAARVPRVRQLLEAGASGGDWACALAAYPRAVAHRFHAMSTARRAVSLVPLSPWRTGISQALACRHSPVLILPSGGEPLRDGCLALANPAGCGPRPIPTAPAPRRARPGTHPPSSPLPCFCPRTSSLVPLFLPPPLLLLFSALLPVRRCAQWWPS